MTLGKKVEVSGPNGGLDYRSHGKAVCGHCGKSLKGVYRLNYCPYCHHRINWESSITYDSNNEA